MSGIVFYGGVEEATTRTGSANNARRVTMGSGEKWYRRVSTEDQYRRSENRDLILMALRSSVETLAKLMAAINSLPKSIRSSSGAGEAKDAPPKIGHPFSTTRLGPWL